MSLRSLLKPYMLKFYDVTMLREDVKALTINNVYYQQVLSPGHDAQVQAVMMLQFGRFFAVFGKLTFTFLKSILARGGDD